MNWSVASPNEQKAALPVTHGQTGFSSKEYWHGEGESNPIF